MKYIKTYENYQSYKGHPIDRIISWLADDYCEAHGFRKSSSINKGYCDYFADELLQELGGETSDTYIVDNDENAPDDSYRVGPDHVWVFHKGKHYDAETPNGVENFLDIPHFKRWLKEKEKRAKRKKN
jgi:hypothetical protein